MNKRNTISVAILIFLAGCAAQPLEKPKLEESYLSAVSKNKALVENEAPAANKMPIAEQAKAFRFVPPLKLNSKDALKAEDVLAQFSNKDTIKVASDNLPLEQFLHYVLGEQLKVSYILADDVKKSGQPITLNLKNNISQKKLFTLTEELLNQRNFSIRFDDNIFYIHKADSDDGKGNVVYGYGKKISDVPQTSFQIMQMVQFEYGMQATIGNTLRQMLGVKTSVDTTRNTITIEAKRKDVIRALELIQLMDQPMMQDRQIGVYKTTYSSTDELIKKLTELLGQEGISVGSSKSTSPALSIVEIAHQGELYFFANSRDVIQRAVFWSTQIDKPTQTSEQQYFIYTPNYSRAVDMGDSLTALISGTASVSNSTSAASQNKKSAPATKNIGFASSKDMKMVVDERANVLIFYTSGEEYQQILPLIKRLDLIPKQVMLEVIIAEVTMADEFKQGVEFAFSSGRYAVNTTGAFFGEGFGGLSYALGGGNLDVAIQLFQSNSLVDILSKPSIVVRDGVSANITVGTDIPIVGETASNPLDGAGSKQTTKIEYRRTGVNLSVTPTINAQGVVLMEINQSVSNTIEAGTTSSLNPSVFERTIQTEVVAESGQTIMLGGLISSNKTKKNTKVPFFGSLPIIGNLFRGETEAGDKTELVVFVTPKVIESSDQWEEIKAKFGAGLANLDINQ
ncbi:secretin N-terminal domain-containing protein [Thalassotalea piscium]|uniref:General secretion pathway protein D n=1 Tax=Thalassotalea piscium TaxID=1230533 RepID=A0A7X0TT64_9GAMM|nr:secretin N-terminal domain-containing protein [Thalassotalea piscium]MBB6542760.1 general secretion pathway protein D [Thalassotalea piscium]